MHWYFHICYSTFSIFPGSIVTGPGRRNDFTNQRSTSDDVDSIGECASLLHPDHAWGSRRGSSQSEQLEVEVYQLGKDFSRSLPGSRRSSFQSAQEQNDQDIPAVPPPSSYSRDRRRSSCTRMLRDPDEILKSLKAVKGELGRTMSLSGDRKHRSKCCNMQCLKTILKYFNYLKNSYNIYIYFTFKNSYHYHCLKTFSNAQFMYFQGIFY